MDGYLPRAAPGGCKLLRVCQHVAKRSDAFVGENKRDRNQIRNLGSSSPTQIRRELCNKAARNTHTHTHQAGRDTPIEVQLLPAIDSGIWMLILSSFELSPKHQISFSPVLLKICSPLPTSDTPCSDGSYFIFYFGDKGKPLIYSLLWLGSYSDLWVLKLF